MPHRKARPRNAAQRLSHAVARAWGAWRAPLPARALMEEFEPRLMYSADHPGALVAQVMVLPSSTAAPAAAPSSAVSSASPGSVVASSLRHELVFIDGATPDIQALVDALLASNDGTRHFELVVLDTQADGITQISNTLAGRQGLDGVHLIGHGSAGAMQLASATLDNARMARDAQAIAGWGRALAADADLLLYGCDFAGNASGQEALATLATLTGADAAASVNPTGTSARGGDWTLEAQHGVIDTGNLIGAATVQSLQGWQHTLASFTVNSTADTGVGTLRQALIDANANAGTDSIVFNIGGVGVHTITLSSSLPAITGTVLLDATTDDSFCGQRQQAGHRPRWRWT
jgi:hypothetical protein